ncbi:hypothetical protein MTO96_033889 [Rhipicephalus appendiculatus]
MCVAPGRQYIRWARITALALQSIDTIKIIWSTLKARTQRTLLTLLPSNREAGVSLAVSLYHECADRSKESMVTASVAHLFGSWALKQWPRDAAATIQESWTFAGQIMRDLGLATFLELINVAGPGEAPAVEMSKPKHVFSMLRRSL